jgi:hypothetical protein
MILYASPLMNLRSMLFTNSRIMSKTKLSVSVKYGLERLYLSKIALNV